MADNKPDRKRRKLPPRDSWIALAPGESVALDPELMRKWDEKKRLHREIRGNYLAACFEIEYQLDLVLSEVFFPGLDQTQDADKIQTTSNVEARERALALKDSFEEVLLKSGHLSFASKIDLLRKLADRINVLGNFVSKEVLTNLDKVRTARNTFAHYPITFKPSGKPPLQDLVPVLMSRETDIILDQSFLDEHSK
ncbi:MAG TPA: hypothetical protein VMW42_13750, partial [Desulfatiglandales bacterium]|nr:hypothetical protein [Desulfatiglandales bacterium]